MPEQRQHRALLAVDNEKARSALRGFFRARSDVVERHPGADLCEAIRKVRPCLILLEAAPADPRFELLLRDFPDIPIVAIVPHPVKPAAEIETLGATAWLTLPLDEAEMAARLTSVLSSLDCPCRAANGAADGASSLFDLPVLFNSSPRMIEIRDTIDKVANTSATVLIRGESGVGKEIAARMIFALSERREKPFVKVNCAAIPNDLLESELFGYEAGAFTGANRAKPGKFELANGGTLFLDEIGEMHPALQAKLLHVLQDGEFARLGAKHDTSVDVRVICATNQLLETRVAEGLFREDLFYRINVVTVTIPPLRERRSEIPNLIRYFLDKYSGLYQRTTSPLGCEALQAMTGYHWPGNIRELENFCKRYVIMGDATSLVREMQAHPAAMGSLIPASRTQTTDQNGNGAAEPGAFQTEPSLLEIGRQAAWEAERQAIERMLVATRWNRREAARRLQVSYKALLNKIKQMEHDKFGQNRYMNS
jgi:two-component system, NtrC family, response regulator AtoC